MTIRETMNAFGREFIIERDPAATEEKIPVGTPVMFSEEYAAWESFGGVETEYRVEVTCSFAPPKGGRPKYFYATYLGKLEDLLDAIMLWEEEREDGK